MIRCGKARWDAKDKICAQAQGQGQGQGQGQVSAPSQTYYENKAEPALPKKETDDALAKLLAERAKLDNFWKQG